MLASSKDSVQGSLAMCRHNLLQVVMKLEEETRRVQAVEKMRLVDIAEIEKLNKLLNINLIKIN